MHPSDLCPPAICLARRVQALPNRQTYTLTVIKVSNQEWLVSVQAGASLEKAT